MKSLFQQVKQKKVWSQNYNKMYWSLKLMEEFYGGGGGTSWLAEDERLASVTCPLPASGGCKKLKPISCKDPNSSSLPIYFDKIFLVVLQF